MTLKHLIVGLCLLVLTSVPAILWLAPGTPELAPDLAVSTLRGEELRIGGPQGRPLLVSFWASTCRSCIHEMPHLVRLHEDFSPLGLQVVAIAMAYDPPNRVVELSRIMQLPYAVALDIDGEAARAFGDVDQTPTAFLISPDGRIVHRSTGAMDTQKLRALIADMTGTRDGQLALVAAR